MSESLERHKADADKLKVGKIIETEQHRDAIHVAVAPVTAGENLRPGEHISITDGAAYLEGEAIGVVDPFLRTNVKKGQQFWLFLYPGSIVDMYHHWLHPAFEGPQGAIAPDKAASEAWLQDFISRSDCPDYHMVIGAVINYFNGNLWNEDCIHFDGVDAHGDIPSEFWDHLEVLTGQKFRKRATYFSCSC